MRGIRAMMILVLLGGGGNTFAQKAKAAAPAQTGPKETYCTSTGGIVEMRRAVYGTNNPQQDWLALEGLELFCQYTLADDGSRIHLSLNTLYATQPTLAALAYYAEIAWNGQGTGNPASYYCTQLGGSEIGATDLAGGGWVSLAKQNNVDMVLEACIFPDNSTIDSWGLFYHSESIVRGIDLSTVLRYSNPYPAKN